MVYVSSYLGLTLIELKSCCNLRMYLLFRRLVFGAIHDALWKALTLHAIIVMKAKVGKEEKAKALKMSS